MPCGEVRESWYSTTHPIARGADTELLQSVVAMSAQLTHYEEPGAANPQSKLEKPRPAVSRQDAEEPKRAICGFAGKHIFLRRFPVPK